MSGQGPAIASLEKTTYVAAQAEDDYSMRERHLEGEQSRPDRRCRCSYSLADYFGLWDDFSASTDKMLGKLVVRLRGE